MSRDLSTLLLGNAVGFRLAAERIAGYGIDDHFPWPPFFTNVGYALELSLKAYVIHQGGTEDDCRNLGHDLCKAVAEAQRRGLSSPCPEVVDLIEKIRSYHMNHSFRYMKPMDESALPTVEQTLSATNKLFQSIAEQLHDLLPH